MMRSMFSGVSGLRIHQTKMDVIANNISNVNTTGYKSSRVTFKDVFNQTISSATAPSTTTGRAGTNPMQIGLGGGVASIDKVMTQGPAQRTDNPLDLMIEGDGFFIVTDPTGQYFTRAGNFILDQNGDISLNGYKLMGWDTKVVDGTIDIDRGTVKPIAIAGDKEYVVPEPTTIVDFTGNINPLKDGTGITRTMKFFDSVGNYYTVDVNFEYAVGSSQTVSTWKYAIGTKQVGSSASFLSVAYANGDRTKPVELQFSFGSNITGSSGTAEGELTFDTNGLLTSVNGAGAGNGLFPRVALQIKPSTGSGAYLVPPATFGSQDPLNPALMDSVLLDFREITQFVGEDSSVLATYRDGNAPGYLNELNVGADGKIMGSYTNGMTKLLGQVPLARFKNPAGLQRVGNSLFVPTANSGEFDGVGFEGSLIGGSLEMSNVDLSQEFTEMITTQRGFQANSRVITTSDDMLQELVNLKR